MQSCLFCNIIQKQEPSYMVYENEYVSCFLDKYPINLGHILVVPKKHYEELSDVDEKSLTEVILASQKIARVLQSILQTDGITMMQNNGVFKDIGHYHMHIIPRYVNDGFSWIEPTTSVCEDEFIHLQKRLKADLNIS